MAIKGIIGVDEVNFSPSIAGDCVVCALFPFEKVPGVKDSKALSKKKRLELFRAIQETSLYVVIPATVNQIIHLNITRPRNQAIIWSVKMLLELIKEMGVNPGKIVKKTIIDGPFTEEFIIRMRREVMIDVVPVVKADEKHYAVSAASIVAKVYVDALFEGFGRFYPGYNIEKNHGSPDRVMYRKLKECGPSPWHRTGVYGRQWWAKINGVR